VSEPGATSRRTFLRQAARTIATGIGITLAIPSIARASTDSNEVCCKANCSLPGGGGCPSGQVKYLCNGSCGQYCTCHNNVGDCYTLVC
jgi:hypothetical protein